MKRKRYNNQLVDPEHLVYRAVDAAVYVDRRLGGTIHVAAHWTVDNDLYVRTRVTLHRYLDHALDGAVDRALYWTKLKTP